MWPSDQCIRLAIQQSLVRVPLWPLAGFVSQWPQVQIVRPNDQLVCLQPVGILNDVMFNLNHLFQFFPRPPSLCAIYMYTAKGKYRLFLSETKKHKTTGSC